MNIEKTVKDHDSVFDGISGVLSIRGDGWVAELKAWPDPYARMKTADSGWAPIDPILVLQDRNVPYQIAKCRHLADKHGQQVFPFYHSPDQRRIIDSEGIFWEWAGTIPAEIRKLLVPFKNNQWPMLRFLAKKGVAGRALTITNPALAYALAQAFHDSTDMDKLRLSKMKQREILGYLGFPPTNATKRIFQKIIPGAISASALIKLKRILGDREKQKILSHLSRINAGVIHVISDPGYSAMVSPNFYRDLAKCKNNDFAPAIIARLNEMKALSEKLEGGDKPLKPFRSMKKLDDFPAVLMPEFKKANLKYSEVTFPPPPLPGNDAIVPLTDVVSIVREGRIQKNCVGKYIKDVVKDRSCYFYKVVKPERCTLLLVNVSETWVPLQIMMAYNHWPSSRTFTVVEQWLRENGITNYLEAMLKISSSSHSQ